MSGRLTRQACAELRADLCNLGYGRAEVETPELIARRLYPVPEHVRALDPSVVLIVGPQGSGKSELFKAFFEHRDLRSAVIRHASKTINLRIQPSSTTWSAVYPPPGPGFPDSHALARQVDSDASAKTLWHTMLIRSLAGEIDDRFKDHVPARDLSAPQAAALDSVEERLRREDRRIFVGYDELDVIGGFDRILTARLVRGLAAFWSDYGRRWQRIRAKIFLPSDLFRRVVRGNSDFAKLAATRSELAWSDADVFGMLIKRIANTSAELAEYCRRARISFDQDETLGLVPRIETPERAHPLLKRVAGEFMGVHRRKSYVRNWVLDHLRDGNAQLWPRTMVRLFEQAAQKEANRTLPAPRLLHPTALREALDDVSRDHLTQALRSKWPWLEGVRERVRPRQFIPWSRAEVVSLLECEWDGAWSSGEAHRIRPPAERPEQLVDYLVELGVFRRRLDDRIDVSDLYLFGLGLRRKGGVPIRIDPGQ